MFVSNRYTDCVRPDEGSLYRPFHAVKTEQYFTEERFCALMKHHVLLAIQAKLKLANCYYFSVAIDSRAKSWQKCGKSRETLKP